MKNILKNKLFIICLFFVLSLSLFALSNKVSAQSYYDLDSSYKIDDFEEFEFVDRNGNKVTMPKITAQVLDFFGVSTKNGVVIKFYNGSFSNIQFFDDDVKLIRDGSYIKPVYSNGSDFNYKSIYYDKNSSSFKCTYFQGYYCGSFGEISYIGSPLVVYNGLNDSNIYLNSTGSSSFFYLPPTVLAEVLKPEEGRKTIAEIVEVLPLILVVVVSFLGLRKALNWLLTLLRHS